MRSCSAFTDTGLSRNSLTPILTASTTRERSPWPVSMMIGTFGYGKVAGERTMRTKAGPSSPGICQSRMTTSGANAADQLEAGLAVRRLMDLAHADAHEHGAHDLAHVMLVVHHHDFGGGEAFGKLFRFDRHRRSVSRLNEHEPRN